MVGLYTVANLADLYAGSIKKLVDGISFYQGVKSWSEKQKGASELGKRIALACQCVRAFVAVAPEIKETVT